jgi:hypothetical protein
MRTVMIAAALVLAAAGCKDKGGGKDKGGAGDPAGGGGGPVALPQLAAEDATMIPTGAPPEMVVIADADGTLRLNAAPDSWAKLGTADLRRGAKQVDTRMVHYALSEARALGHDGERFMKMWSETPTDMMLPPPEPGDEDPPPPEDLEEDEHEDESGGTGTAMALEEGKMGKKEEPRIQGQYTMKKVEDPEVVRARKRGACGAIGWIDRDDQGANRPARMCDVDGSVVRDGDVAKVSRGDAYSILLAAPTAKAAPLVDVLDETELIGVAVGGKVRALRVVFPHHREVEVTDPNEARWIEVRIWPVGLDIEAVPAVAHPVPWASGPLDAKAVAAAYEQALAERGLDKDYPVDVLVSPEVDMQRLVDVLVALDQAGANAIGLGAVAAKGHRQASLRGRRIAHAELRLGAVVGDVDRKAVNDTFAAEQPKIAACYEELLATKADAAGDVAVMLAFDKKGAVTKAAAKGVDPALETCVAGVWKKVKFPAPVAGTVQVTARYTMSN